MKVLNGKVYYDRMNEMVVGPGGARQIARRFEILACAAEQHDEDYGCYDGEFVPIESIEIGDEVLYHIHNDKGQIFVDVVNVFSINEDEIGLISANNYPAKLILPIRDNLIFKLSHGIYGWNPECVKWF